MLRGSGGHRAHQAFGPREQASGQAEARCLGALEPGTSRALRRKRGGNLDQLGLFSPMEFGPGAFDYAPGGVGVGKKGEGEGGGPGNFGSCDLKMKIEEAYQFCERMAKSHYENFPVGSLMIPKEKRPYVWSIYAFARTADDFADENYPSRKDFSDDATWREAIRNGEAGRLEKLEEWGSELAACYEGTPTHPIFLALSKTIDDLKIPQRLLSDLLSAFRMDVTTRRHADWDSVLHYCRHSA